jgi:hypothetical protein
MNLQHGDSGATFFGSSSSNDDSDFNERNAVTPKVVKMSTGDESNPYKEIANLKRKLKKMEKSRTHVKVEKVGAIAILLTVLHQLVEVEVEVGVLIVTSIIERLSLSSKFQFSPVTMNMTSMTSTGGRKGLRPISKGSMPQIQIK